MSAILLAACLLGPLGLVCGYIDGRSRYAVLIALLTLAAFYPLIELLYLDNIVPWTPLITRHMAVLSTLNFQILVPALLVPYFVGRWLARSTRWGQTT